MIMMVPMLYLEATLMLTLIAIGVIHQSGCKWSTG